MTTGIDKTSGVVAVLINHERFGEKTTFASLEEAVETIRSIGDEFSRVTLSVRGGEVVDERGDVVGVVTKEASCV